MHPDKLAEIIFQDILRTQSPDIRQDSELSWRRVLDFKQSAMILSASTAHNVDPIAGYFTCDNGKLIYWKLIDSLLITFIYGTTVTPIDEANHMMTRAIEIGRGMKSMKLVTAMLTCLQVVGVLDKHITLKPRKAFLYASMLKRQDKILEVIKMADPKVESISIISGIEG